MTISEAIDKIFKVVNKVGSAMSEDSPGGKKITLIEGFGIAIQGIGLIPVVTAFNKLKEDWLSRDEDKKAEWIEAFKQGFDIPNDELEVQIETLVQALLSFEGFFLTAKNSVPPAPGSGDGNG